MKNSILLVIIVLLFTYCSKNDSTPNGAPSAPSLVSPTENKLCIKNLITFEWAASTDPENNPITYRLEVSSDILFTQIVKSVDGTEISQIVLLEKGKTYYWRVKAIDSNNGSSTSVISSFLTDGYSGTNHLPFLPQIIAPTNNNSIATGTSTTLKWTATDADTADVLTYDVYLDTQNPPTAKIGTNISANSLDLNSLLPNTWYYWYVVVRDNKGGESEGQIWNFKTN